MAGCALAASAVMAQAFFDPKASKKEVEKTQQSLKAPDYKKANEAKAQTVINECCLKNEACCNPPQPCCNPVQKAAEQNCCGQENCTSTENCAPEQNCPVQQNCQATQNCTPEQNCPVQQNCTTTAK